MAQGMRNGGTGAARDALDLCVRRLRQGESIEGCLADYPELADELRPLLVTYAEIADSVPPAPDMSDAARFVASMVACSCAG